MIDISYRIFDLVASTNSLTKTAEIVHLTPSAVSHSLRKLEERLGMQLVVRNRDGLRLTQYGQELIPHVRYALKAEERLQQEIVRICDIRPGILNVGVCRRSIPRSRCIFTRAAIPDWRRLWQMGSWTRHLYRCLSLAAFRRTRCCMTD